MTEVSGLDAYEASAEEEAVFAECRAAQEAGQEISDGCARTIAAWYQENGRSAEFVSTGAIPQEPSDVWRSCFYLGNRSLYRDMPPSLKLAADMLGTYLVRAGRRGPVPGWSKLWVQP
jgi:hypothetical protein